MVTVIEDGIVEEIRFALIKHFLYVVVLTTLKHRTALSGYDFMEIILKRFNFAVSSGTIYALLYQLERKGLTEGKTTAGKRVYSLTEKGAAFINSILESKEEIIEFAENILKD
jgi:DNA-binding PadR family transcriptional regulator